MDHLEIVQAIYRQLTGLTVNRVIPVTMRPPSLVGTVQDDPFDTWVGDQIRGAIPDVEVVPSGSLTTPDLVIRHRITGTLVGIEVKKLIQRANGADPRGLTLDYNSCLPCGTSLVKVGEDTVAIPNFYLFCLLNQASTGIVTLILMDGDFLNYDFKLHKEAKTSNTTEYNHGPYGEGSYRNRKMYTYPNPLNSTLTCFHLQQSLVMKSNDATNKGLKDKTRFLVRRDDIHGNQFFYSVLDIRTPHTPGNPPLITGIFDACKSRTPRERVPYMVQLPPR